MSMEIYVISDQHLDSIASWQRAIDAEGFDMRLSDETPFDDLDGFLPVAWRDLRTGFECDHWQVSDLVETYPGVGLGGHRHALAFRFFGGPGELETAWMAATAYARATRGVVFDPQESRICTPSEAAQVVREIEAGRPAFEAMMQQVLKRLRSPP